MEDIIENVTILFENGVKKIYEAIAITKNGVLTGHIQDVKNKGKEFVNYSFIPRDQIQKLIVMDENIRSKVFDFEELLKQEEKSI
jgi:hypothetical protein